MEVRGIEPLSESPYSVVSTIIFFVLTFPPSNAQRQALDFSSFMVIHVGSKLCRVEDPRVEARIQAAEGLGGLHAIIRQRLLNYLQRLFLMPAFNVDSGVLRMAAPLDVTPVETSAPPYINTPFKKIRYVKASAFPTLRDDILLLFIRISMLWF